MKSAYTVWCLLSTKNRDISYVVIDCTVFRWDWQSASQICTQLVMDVYRYIGWVCHCFSCYNIHFNRFGHFTSKWYYIWWHLLTISVLIILFYIMMILNHKEFWPFQPFEVFQFDMNIKNIKCYDKKVSFRNHECSQIFQYYREAIKKQKKKYKITTRTYKNVAKKMKAGQQNKV